VITVENKLAWGLSLLAVGSYSVVLRFIVKNEQLPFVIIAAIANVAVAYFMTRKLTITPRRRWIFLAGHGLLTALGHALIMLGIAVSAMIYFKLDKLT
jgi:hypothetical protein